MELVVGTNKIPAAVFKPGESRRIVLLSGIKFYTPKETFAEIRKHREEFCRRKKIRIEVFGYILEARALGFR